MERARLSIMLLSVCVLSAACAKKAKMRTVPRQAPAATVATGAVPAAPAESPDVDPAPAPTPRPTEVVTGPVPAPADPMTPLDDSGDNHREARPVPVRVARPDVRTGGGELNRPRPIAPPREENCNCDDVGPRERVVAPRQAPVPRPRPIVRERPIVEERVERRQEFELDPTDVLHCRWEPTGKPMTYLKYDPITRTAWVQHGWIKRANGQEGPISNAYTQVRLVSGLPPYGFEGVSLVAKSGSPIAHLKPSGAGKIWYERNTTYPYEALYGAVPGAPQGQSIHGVCWTKSEPAKTDEPSGGG